MNDAYRAAGVNIDAAQETVQRYRSLLAGRSQPQVLDGLGGFGGCFALQGVADPVLVASTDGVGTKVLIAAALGRYDTIGADLVHHCINDILCCNARPLFFLDYLAVGVLNPDVAAAVVSGVADACQCFGVALLGGETAEMPGVYEAGHFDLAGTIVGVVERRELIDPGNVAAGDVVLGLPANGLHTNGYSLARRVLPAARWDEPVGSGSAQTIGDALLAVHPCYLPYVRTVQRAGIPVKSMAHITGGGLLDNLPRAFGEHLAARLDPSRWQVPAICRRIVDEARLAPAEAYRVFNMGVGFCLVVAAGNAQLALAVIREELAAHPIAGAAGSPDVIGEIEPRHPCGPSVIIANGA
jgi:phosphoribosylformylglycinamidine cyclo-ligase